ncbi:hypothetical protein HBI88_091240 [Parastagonospora nodorum]|nr:hypothetical protein HBI74_161050 [Parastagonospora nodorum]KAH5029851.1 hypothetical protein HBI75_127970 [Parastagonospora nodorum]KAH5056028.1 hypothetical protein HBH96_125510 [Parastagonospora nodorum]KAH5228137.1 hypothetical protein HBI62_082330 [Parastagonospora nodorum]KAH5448919.1 hypothetical protein HBI30_165520 [Parastagonospora nodorum]
MFTFTVITDITALTMAWTVITFMIKGWALQNERISRTFLKPQKKIFCENREGFHSWSKIQAVSIGEEVNDGVFKPD